MVDIVGGLNSEGFVKGGILKNKRNIVNGVNFIRQADFCAYEGSSV